MREKARWRDRMTVTGLPAQREGERFESEVVLSGRPTPNHSSRNSQRDFRRMSPQTSTPQGFEMIGELAYNYPNPFRSSQGTTSRHTTNEPVQEMIVRIFNLSCPSHPNRLHALDSDTPPLLASPRPMSELTPRSGCRSAPAHRHHGYEPKSCVNIR